MDYGTSKHVTHDKNIFSKFHDKEGGLHVEFGYDDKYLVKGLGSISFQMPLGDVLELYFVLYVPWLTKTFLLVSCITYLQSLDEFDGQQVTIRDNRHGFYQALARALQEGGPYRILVNTIEQV